MSRFAYNWALARNQELYEEYKAGLREKTPNQYELRKELNVIKREQFPWMLESTKCAPQEAIIDLGKAMDNFFKGRAKFPKFKKRGVRDSFRLSSGQFAIKDGHIRIPNVGWIRLTEQYRHPEATPLSATVSRRADKWFVSITADVAGTKPAAPSGIVGVDVGVRECVLSNGERHQVPRAYRAAEAKLRRAQQSLARKDKDSNNRLKAKSKVALAHYRVANVRKDWTHKLTTRIADSASIIVIEDLNVSGMLNNRRLAKSISDANFFEFRRQLEYKTSERGSTLVIADRFYPSSKLCFNCGMKTKSLPLSVREWVCDGCSAVLDRDKNAADNLAAYAASYAVSACGEFSASAKPGVTGRSKQPLRNRNESQTSHELV